MIDGSRAGITREGWSLCHAFSSTPLDTFSPQVSRRLSAWILLPDGGEGVLGGLLLPLLLLLLLLLLLVLVGGVMTGERVVLVDVVAAAEDEGLLCDC